MAYAVYGDINLLTNITSSDIVDADVTSLISYATYQLNHDINTKVIRERIDYLDQTRQNKINGSNTDYYIRNWRGNYFADNNDDGSISTSDVTVYQVTSDGTETTLTVSAIDQDDCYITLDSAPTSGVTLYITYSFSPVSESTPDPLVKMACVYLTAYLCYSKINIGKAPEAVFGNMRLRRHMKSAQEYYVKYQLIVNQINAKMTDIKESRGI